MLLKDCFELAIKPKFQRFDSWRPTVKEVLKIRRNSWILGAYLQFFINDAVSPFIMVMDDYDSLYCLTYEDRLANDWTVL